VLDFNPYQQIFMLFYAILYGVMLNHLSRFNPFPFNKIFLLSNNDEQHIIKDKSDEKGKENKENIRRRIRVNRRHRLGISFITINLLPFIYFILIFNILKNYQGFYMREWSLILLIISFSFSIFMFYRLYRLLVVILADCAFWDIWELPSDKGGIGDNEPKDWRGDFLAFCLYFSLPWIWFLLYRFINCLFC